MTEEDARLLGQAETKLHPAQENCEQLQKTEPPGSPLLANAVQHAVNQVTVVRLLELEFRQKEMERWLLEPIAKLTQRVAALEQELDVLRGRKPKRDA